MDQLEAKSWNDRLNPARCQNMLLSAAQTDVLDQQSLRTALLGLYGEVRGIVITTNTDSSSGSVRLARATTFFERFEHLKGAGWLAIVQCGP